MHNHNGKGDNSMMWMMVLCCAMPFIFLLFAGSTVFSGGYLKYVIIGGLAAVCFWMMFRRHGGHDADSEDGTKGSSDQSGAEGKSKRDGRCH
ncbi:hypothetical protein A3A42_03360 [Candidatus Kaiserbacteria bacterium RIFCSPLOWO2_01_FULL_55_25]|nr:MAG: hypothetical protein A3A42_03360 [Candidatus Kaiserbacteria bacterium RIFCSPLOWO2_01_FULL_55_25]